ncbi:MAG: alpha/beta hydrolase [Cellvibrionaceae bacterium]|nr:alpha/beta hydrolase [Cellvibrionaceae bacterium]
MAASSVLRSATERSFCFNGFRYAAQHWGQADEVPALALHGWLDNSGSFSILAPQLQGIQILAPDLAGHGLSDHRAAYTEYTLWSELPELIAMADAMGWETFALIGHSRGAMMAHMLAGAMPERISHLLLIDAIVPPPADADAIAQRLAKSLLKMPTLMGRNSLFSSYEAAVLARSESEYGRISVDNAAQLATRGLSAVEGGYRWHADAKLRAPTGIRLSREQLLALFNEVTAPTLALMGKTGWLSLVAPGSPLDALTQQVLARASLQMQTFDDGHFLHMETAALEVATAISRFILETTADV